MTSYYDYHRFQEYLFELESALSLIGIRDCQDLTDDSQLGAAIFALLRASSLFRSILTLLEARLMDASDVMRRACWEAWILGYEFRIHTAARHASLWHKEKHKHGLAKISRVKAFEHTHGVTTSTYGTSYGGLSEVSHPNKSAAENSIITIKSLHGANSTYIEHAYKTITEEDLPGLMYLLIWTVVAEADELVSLGIVLDNIPKCASYYRLYESQHPNTSGA